jgi:hypothetical protein
MLNRLSWVITDILPAMTAMFVMCVAMLPFLMVTTAVVSWRKQRKNAWKVTGAQRPRGAPANR